MKARQSFCLLINDLVGYLVLFRTLWQFSLALDSGCFFCMKLTPKLIMLGMRKEKFSIWILCSILLFACCLEHELCISGVGSIVLVCTLLVNRCVRNMGCDKKWLSGFSVDSYNFKQFFNVIF